MCFLRGIQRTKCLSTNYSHSGLLMPCQWEACTQRYTTKARFHRSQPTFPICGLTVRAVLSRLNDGFTGLIRLIHDDLSLDIGDWSMPGIRAMAGTSLWQRGSQTSGEVRRERQSSNESAGLTTLRTPQRSGSGSGYRSMRAAGGTPRGVFIGPIGR